MRNDRLIEQLHELRTRATRFHAGAVTSPQRSEPLLDEALFELGVALEELRVSEEELRSQNDRLVGGHTRLHERLRHLQEWMHWAPDAALETGLGGVIRQANQAAGELLEVRADLLVGKPLAVFVPAQDRRRFRLRLRQLDHAEGAVQDWTLRMVTRSHVVRLVEAHVRAVAPSGGTQVVAWWSLRARQEPGFGPTGMRPAGLVPTGLSLPGAAALALRSVMVAGTTLCPVAGAGVMLADEHGVPRWETATDPLAQAFEDAQASLEQGPCIDVLRAPTLLWTTDVATDPRWPELGKILAGKGIGSVVCAPLVAAGDANPIGSFILFTAEPVDWIADAAPIAQTLAAMAVLLLRSTIDLHKQQTLTEQLQHALHHRVLIEQAKGVLMGRNDVDEEQAWALLRGYARTTQRRAAEVAEEIVKTRQMPTTDKVDPTQDQASDEPDLSTIARDSTG